MKYDSADRIAHTLGHEPVRACVYFLKAGEQGFEPQLSDPESDVLPLDDSPIAHQHRSIRDVRLTGYVSPSRLAR